MTAKVKDLFGMIDVESQDCISAYFNWRINQPFFKLRNFLEVMATAKIYRSHLVIHYYLL